jgi:hypothetical protein
MPSEVTVLLTRRQAARALCLQEQTLAARESRGHPLLPKLKVGGRALYRQADIEALIERSVVSVPTCAPIE